MKAEQSALRKGLPSVVYGAAHLLVKVEQPTAAHAPMPSMTGELLSGGLFYPPPDKR